MHDIELEGPLDALGLFDVELPTFTAILSNVFTYLIILITMLPKPIVDK